MHFTNFSHFKVMPTAVTTVVGWLDQGGRSEVSMDRHLHTGKVLNTSTIHRHNMMTAYIHRYLHTLPPWWQAPLPSNGNMAQKITATVAAGGKRV